MCIQIPVTVYREIVDDYRILCGHTPAEVETCVKEFILANGRQWVMCGGITCGTVGDRITCYSQAVKKVHYEIIS